MPTSKQTHDCCLQNILKKEGISGDNQPPVLSAVNKVDQGGGGLVQWGASWTSSNMSRGHGWNPLWGIGQSGLGLCMGCGRRWQSQGPKEGRFKVRPCTGNPCGQMDRHDWKHSLRYPLAGGNKILTSYPQAVRWDVPGFNQLLELFISCFLSNDNLDEAKILWVSLSAARKGSVFRSVCQFTRGGGMMSLPVSGLMFFPGGSAYLLADPREHQGCTPPPGLNSFIFMQFLQNDTNLGVSAQPSQEKSWIRHWYWGVYLPGEGASASRGLCIILLECRTYWSAFLL